MGTNLKLLYIWTGKMYFGLDKCLEGWKTYGQFQKCLFKS